MALPDYNRVALFVRVVRAGSFTAAAAEVGLPKSSLSRGVSRLEEELGVRLLQRTTRRMTLTDGGQAYYESVEGSVRAIDEADASARERGGEPSGTVRIAAPPDLALADALAAFQARYPKILVEVSVASRRVDLVAEGFDLAIRAGRLEDSSLVVQRIGSTPLVLMAATSYLEARGRPRSVAELARHDFLLYRAPLGRASLQLAPLGGESDGGRAPRAKGSGKTVSVVVQGTLVADDMNFLRAAAEAGAGIALLPMLMFASRTGGLELVLRGWGLAEGGLYVVLPTSRLVPRRVALVRDHLVAYLRDLLKSTRTRCQTQARAHRGSLRR